MQHDAVLRVPERAEQGGLLRRRVLEQGQGRIPVHGQDRFVEVQGCAIRQPDPNAGLCAGQARHADTGAEVGPCGLHQLPDIGPAAARHRPPEPPAGDAHHPVVEEEADQGGGGIVADAVQGGRPDGCSHGQEVVVPEGGAESAMLKIGVEGGSRALQPPQVVRRPAVEAQDVGDHAPEARTEQIALLGDEGVGRVLQVTTVQGD